jgi:hypothetical protein
MHRALRPACGQPLRAQRLHEASSTIQAQNAGKPIPRIAACSGASEVGVIPGWVFVSRRINP